MATSPATGPCRAWAWTWLNEQSPFFAVIRVMATWHSHGRYQGAIYCTEQSISLLSHSSFVITITTHNAHGHMHIYAYVWLNMFSFQVNATPRAMCFNDVGWIQIDSIRAKRQQSTVHVSVRCTCKLSYVLRTMYYVLYYMLNTTYYILHTTYIL